MAKILIVGASSKTAEAIVRIFMQESQHEFILLSSNADLLPKIKGFKIYQINSLDKQGTKKICLAERPDVIINTVAMNDVDQCEVDKRLAWELNVYIVENLARIAKIIDAHFITFSTDYVFDGKKGPYTEDDVPNPLSYYGKSKLAGENMCLAGHNKSTIIRTNVVYGLSSYGKTNFIHWILEKLEKEEPINVITGQYCNPTFTDDLAISTLKIIDKKRFGIYHVAGADWLNRFEIANKVADVFAYDSELIKPQPPDSFIQKAKRPEKGGLITLKAKADLGLNYCGLESGLQALKFQLSEFNRLIFKG
jgi:dTDP-4-dehydrorhamnose reductase